MKLRIHHQEIRVRLSPRDLTHLETQDSLQDRLQLTPTQSWMYTLALGTNDSHGSIATNADATSITVNLPLARFRKWLASTDIEWEIQQTDPALSVLIEKDLKPNRPSRGL